MASNVPKVPVRVPARAAAGWFATAAVFVAILVAGCTPAPPEQALRESVARLSGAIESRDADALDDLLAEDFVGRGGIDRDAALRLARLQFLRNRAIGLVPGPLDVALQDRHATVRATVVATGGSGAWLPERGSVYRVETGWRRDGDAWALTSIDWERDAAAGR